MRTFGEVLMVVAGVLLVALSVGSGYRGVPMWREARRPGESPVRFRSRRRVRALDRLPSWVAWALLLSGIVGLVLNRWG